MVPSAVCPITDTLITDVVADLFYTATHQLPQDIFERLNSIYQLEVGENAREATRQILENAVKARQKQRPMCQDTGFPVVFVELGRQCPYQGDLAQAINQGVAKGYTEHYLRKSMVKDPVFDRTNTGDNTPAIIHTELVDGDHLKIMVEPKGTGSESMSALTMLKPSQGVDGIKQFILDAIFRAGANPCPPLLLGIGIGGTFEKAALMAKRALFDPVLDADALRQKADGGDPYAGLALELIQMVNETGIGTQGLGGVQMCIGVNIRTFATHIGALPVALNVQCHAARHAEAVIEADGTVTHLGQHIGTEARFDEASEAVNAHVVKLQTPVSAEQFAQLRAGDRVHISGTIYTARDAAHKRMMEAYEATGAFPFPMDNQIIYYVGPVPAMADEVIGPAGPTTAARMDKYAPFFLNHGLKAMIGKGYRSAEVIDAMKANGAVYMVGIGGAAVVIADSIKQCDVVAYPELGPEAVYRLEVENFPAIVAIDSQGNNIHEQGREAYRKRDLPADMAG
ncbi:MAG: fumarate hydratase [Cyanobacteria bacterium HKST-UBA03]|nr:fumarate hydratase [Cyanobacteria bacterium HKST-UBA03]